MEEVVDYQLVPRRLVRVRRLSNHQLHRDRRHLHVRVRLHRDRRNNPEFTQIPIFAILFGTYRQENCLYNYCYLQSPDRRAGKHKKSEMTRVIKFYTIDGCWLNGDKCRRSATSATRTTSSTTRTIRSEPVFLDAGSSTERPSR